MPAVCLGSATILELSRSHEREGGSSLTHEKGVSPHVRAPVADTSHCHRSEELRIRT